MLGYITKKQAKADGFTNHGWYFGIPVWISEDGPYGLTVATKWAPMEYLMTCFHYIEGFIQMVTDKEPGFNFKIGDEI